METTKTYHSFAEFYPFYLEQHSHPVCRGLHYFGSSSGLALVIYALFSGQFTLILLAPLIGYGFAWIGHFFFEHNKPATFQYPLYSFIGDWVMLKDAVTGKLKQ